MIVILGIVLVLGAIAGGYTMEHGNFKVLIQPAEVIIIFGAAIGTVVAANPLSTLKRLVGGILGLLKGNPYSKALYLETLKMLYDVFSNARRLGVAKLV